MKCIVCKSQMAFFFNKIYRKFPFNIQMKDIGPVSFYKCKNCGFVISKTHIEMGQERFKKLNNDFHNFLEKNKTEINQPPYFDQAFFLNLLAKNSLIDMSSFLDVGGGYGTLSRILKKYFDYEIKVYDPYVSPSCDVVYIPKDDLKKYSTVFSSALLEHLFRASDLEFIHDLVAKRGVMIFHTLVCENVPCDPDWFYIDPPVHTSFFTNKSMSILMDKWQFNCSIYSPSAKTWALFRAEIDDIKKIESTVDDINRENQSNYLFFKEGFVDYWKGF